MKRRGEAHFLRLPRFGARFYDRFLSAGPIQSRNREVAEQIAACAAAGRLLDVGMGPGRLLLEIHRLRPELELYGLDISQAMVDQARRILADVPADLRQGNARESGFPGDFFDTITCVGSFYLWDEPEAGLNEVFRILKTGGRAYFFEIFQDIDEAEYHRCLELNLRELDLVRRIFGPMALRTAIRAGYRTDEYAAIVSRSKFGGSFAVEKITLSRLPIWLRITMSKGAGAALSQTAS